MKKRQLQILIFKDGVQIDDRWIEDPREALCIAFNDLQRRNDAKCPKCGGNHHIEMRIPDDV